MYKKYNRGYVILVGSLVVILCSYIKARGATKKEGFQVGSDETACDYVSSRGIMKSCDVHSSDPISSIKELKGYDFSKIVDGSTVYIASSAIPAFVKLFKTIPHRIILVSGDCDETVSEDIFSSSHEFLEFIEQDKIIHWFSQNCTVHHHKISQIPIGLDYHTLARGGHAWGSKATPIKQETTLKDIQKLAPPFHKKKISCYANFQFTLDGKFGHERKLAVKEIPADAIFYEPKKLSREATWKAQSEYAFVVSPPGNGLDCHRTWEAISLGCIPIVKSSALNPLYRDLPVLIVNSWSDITVTKLEAVIEEFQNKTFDFNRLELSYWIKKIREGGLPVEK